MNALAYTVGHNIVFARGQYAPETTSGRKLMIHELAHVLQQSSSGKIVQRAPAGGKLEIVDERKKVTNPTTQRQAAKSCDIKCGKDVVGTLHAMPLFSHIYDKDRSKAKIVPAGSAAATGVGIALHFLKTPKASACGCNDFEFIQVVETTHPGNKTATVSYPRSFVDVNEATPKYKSKTGAMTPYYGEWAGTGKHVGPHTIPEAYPDSGATVDTTQSIYDRPSRDPKTELTDKKTLDWKAEATVVCKGKGPDKILGGVTWGFERKFNAKTKDYDPVKEKPTQCFITPSTSFITTLTKGTTTGADDELKDYAFEGKKKP